MKKVFLAATLSAFVVGAGAETPSFLFYTGESRIAAGRTETISSLDGFVFALGDSVSRNNVAFFIDNTSIGRGFTLFLSAPIGEELTAGSYGNATRAIGAPLDRPGLWFAGNGAGSNDVTGAFQILEVSFDVDNKVSSLAVDFTQNEENGLQGWTSGSFRYHSAVPIAASVPEPSALLLLAIGLFTVRPRRSCDHIAANSHATQHSTA